MCGLGEEAGAVIENEFASVTVVIDERGHDRRLRVVDNHTGRTAYFDALLLETLAWTPEAELRGLLDPARHRWTVDPGPDGTTR
ncbi:hypothetical protein SAMN05443637_118136 [Pseudonocardia thermophila]|uniref:Uncharacterized protein n=1 Tax=Pseudonocardia thermophila TaxID=1848 RepID=A0A1M6Y1X6_PSETH|nr:hypothetical protein [Pseudonocardia thermophila]SHL12133.1 hypothetical protein SAMN05443637_118136 [Pseudonocardia thermophila]